MTKSFLALPLLLLATSCTQAAPTITQAGVDKTGLKTFVGFRVEMTGVFGGPGKEADYIKLNDNELVYLKGKMSGLTPSYGQRITVTGILRYDPGFLFPPNINPQVPTTQGIPPHYFIESAELVCELTIESWDHIAFHSPWIVEGGNISKWQSKQEAEAVMAHRRDERMGRVEVLLAPNLNINAKVGFEAEIDEIQNWLVSQGATDIVFRLAMSSISPPVIRECRNGKTVVPASSPSPNPIP